MNQSIKLCKGLLFFTALLLMHNLKAQSGGAVLEGLIINTQNAPVDAATVSITDAAGKKVTTITEADGSFIFNNLSVGTSNIVVSHIIYITETLTQVINAGSNKLNIVLKDAESDLSDIVVVGYGTQRRINMTGAVASVNLDNDVMASRPVTNISTALTGMLPGMSIMQGDGTPAADGGTMRVRGTGSLNAGSDPLVIIDGQPGDINTVNPNDVASVSVLKDAASAAIYGSRASNGVVLITTKTGSNSNGKVSFQYVGSVGKASPTKLFDVVSNTADHMTLVNRIQSNSGLNPLFNPTFIDNWRQKSNEDPILYPNTNWWDAILKQNTIHNHSLTARGGNEKINFFNSFGYLGNNGIIDKTSFTRFTFRSNLSYKVNNWLKLGSNLTALFSKADPVDIDQIWVNFESLTPGIYPKHPDGRYGGAMTGGSEQQSGNNNIIRGIETSLGEKQTQNYTGKLYLNLTPIKGLELNGSYFIDMYKYDSWSSTRPANTWNFQTETISLDAENGARLGIYNSYTKRQRHIFDMFGTYSISFGNNNLSTLLGYNQEYFKENRLSASKRDLYSLDIPVLDAAPNDPQAGGNAYDFAMQSYFGRLNYDYLGKYLLEANFRYDGSSRFNPQNRWGFFPSFSIGWVVSQENFWNEIRDNFSFFKLRASWGQLGNNGIGNYEWQSVYNAANHSFNGHIVQGLAPMAIANSNITWETTDVLNIGTDMTLFKNLSVTMDYYDKLTHGILANIPIPHVNGGLTAPRVNSAKVKNSGFEADIKYNKSFGDFRLMASVNFAYNKNKIISYKGDYLEPHGTGVWTENQPIGIFWVREIDRIVQNQSEIDALVNDGWTFQPSTPGPGDFLYKDTNGDKKINDDDRVLKGNPIPLFNYGASVNLGYKNFDFFTLISGISGWDKYLNAQLFSLQPRIDGYLYPLAFLNSWTTDNSSTTIPKLYVNNPKNNQQSDYYLHDASFLRIKTIQLGYSLPENTIQRFFVNKLRFYVNLENFFTFTSYPGMDPETNGSRSNGSITYPLMKTVTFGVNINL